MIDYTILYRGTLPVDESMASAGTWDLFLSASNQSDRVKWTSQNITADKKELFVHPEYLGGHQGAADGSGNTDGGEAAFVANLLRPYESSLPHMKICVDITGMMRPHIMVLTRMLFQKGVKTFDVLYSEPDKYLKQENTQFSILPVITVRPVQGFEGSHNVDSGNDLLIIGSGYDDPLIAQVAEAKRSAKKIQIFGLPSLRPDMYQENVLRARRAAEAVGAFGASLLNAVFAPANDPFVTASVLQSLVNRENDSKSITNLYLCPLATKPQALGFALYYIRELQDAPASVIFPFAQGYSDKTSVGLSRICRYTVEWLS